MEQLEFCMCTLCGTPASEYHELVFGSANRDTCLEYNVKLPLCRHHHNEAHSNKWKYLKKFGSMVGFDPNCLYRAIHNHKKHHRYLMIIKSRFADFLEHTTLIEY